MSPFVRRSLFLLLAAISATPALAKTQWYAVYFGGRQIGHMVQSRELRGGQVNTRTEMELSIARAGEPMSVVSREYAEETRSGKPLRFAAELHTNGSHSKVEGDVADGMIAARLQQAQQEQSQQLPWPRGALLPEGQRLATLQAGFQPGTHYRMQAFDGSSLSVLDFDTEVIGPESIELPEARAQGIALRQQIGRGEHVVTVRSWVRANDALPLRMQFPALGLELDMRACSQRCALAQAEPADIFAGTVIAAPGPLNAAQRQSTLHYSLQLDGVSAEPLGQVPGQSWQASATGIDLFVAAKGDASAAPQAADRAANRWLQSDDSAVLAFATAAVRGSRRPHTQMRRLEAAVRQHIERKSLRIGYASALEVLQLKEGDCTEHAVLLAASARALGIPARVVTGLAYAPAFDGERDRFVPHAWVLAWLGQRWQGFDAALAGFDTGHIALALGDGDPFNFYAGVDLLGRVQIRAIEPAARYARRGNP